MRIHHSAPGKTLRGAFGLVVIDEVHRSRNAGTAQASAIQELQAEEVVGTNRTIVYNQSSELTGILSLAPGQEARWKLYIRTGQKNPLTIRTRNRSQLD